MCAEEVLLQGDEVPGLQYRVWRPAGDLQAEDALLLLHGVESHSEWFEEIAPP
ncbi:MAG: hypothetical protein V1918_10810 [Planctomycetota bacterium]